MAKKPAQEKAPSEIRPGAKFTVKKRVTEMLIKIEKEREYIFQLDGEMYRAKAVKSRTGAAADKEPPYLMSVTDMQNGETGVIIVPTVLRTELDENYPDASYVGKIFSITMHRIEGKAYNTFEICEMQIEE